ncbi:hypothetical protein MCOR25_007909 [Pyricularia grisea]|nr:hypothetical protein MCOR25_007909 [Pyricularia grisea]
MSSSQEGVPERHQLDSQAPLSEMFHERAIFVNRAATGTAPEVPADTLKRVREFHRQLTDFEPTPLMQLVQPEVDAQIFVKDESRRAGHGSFKILGTSWAIYRAVVGKLGLSEEASMQEVAAAARDNAVVLYASGEIMHGHAVAYMAEQLGIEAKIYMPSDCPLQDKLAVGDQATLVPAGNNLDQALSEARNDSLRDANGLLISDCAIEGYEQIPRFIVEGYSTIFTELDEQLKALGVEPTLILVPVGVGSLAQAAVRHYKTERRLPAHRCAIVTVEPEDADCLYLSIRDEQATEVKPGFTNMHGINCGVVSKIAFPELLHTVDACVTVCVRRADEACREMGRSGVPNGPCGAATLAALWRLQAAVINSGFIAGLFGHHSNVILLNTEGTRFYNMRRGHFRQNCSHYSPPGAVMVREGNSLIVTAHPTDQGSALRGPAGVGAVGGDANTDTSVHGARY